jgi:hypothetical protein
LQTEYIANLTPSQLARLDEYIKWWSQNWLTTGSSDEEKVEKALGRFYKRLGRKEPFVIWCDSPFQMGVMPFLLKLVCFQPSESQRRLLRRNYDRGELYKTLRFELARNLNDELWMRAFDNLMAQLTPEMELACAHEPTDPACKAMISVQRAIGLHLEKIMGQAHSDMRRGMSMKIIEDLNTELTRVSRPATRARMTFEQHLSFEIGRRFSDFNVSIRGGFRTPLCPLVKGFIKQMGREFSTHLARLLTEDYLEVAVHHAARAPEPLPPPPPGTPAPFGLRVMNALRRVDQAAGLSSGATQDPSNPVTAGVSPLGNDPVTAGTNSVPAGTNDSVAAGVSPLVPVPVPAGTTVPIPAGTTLPMPAGVNPLGSEPLGSNRQQAIIQIFPAGPQDPGTAAQVAHLLAPQILERIQELTNEAAQRMQQVTLESEEALLHLSDQEEATRQRVIAEAAERRAQVAAEATQRIERLAMQVTQGTGSEWAQRSLNDSNAEGLLAQAMTDYALTWATWSQDFFRVYLMPMHVLDGEPYRQEVKEELEELSILRLGAFMYVFGERIVFACKNPLAVRLDHNQQLHSYTSPSVEFLDGFSLYSWQGVAVEKKLLDCPELLTVRWIENERNTERRRVLVERYGAAKFLMDSGAQLIAEDEYGSLFCKQMPGDEPLVMVRVKNSTPEPDGTFKDYFLRVPPQVRTPREAVAWTFGLDSTDYEPERQT